jgi:NAD(P)H-hydrate epimerase
MRLALRDEIRSLESELIQDGGYPSAALMETAGRLAAEAVLARHLHGRRRVRIACGRGNNGGDGFVIARYLREAGLDVRVQLVGAVADLAADPLRYARLYQWCGGDVAEVVDGALGALRDGELQIDALLGTGLDRPVEGAYAMAVAALNDARRAGADVIALDIPSGLDADAGRPLGDAVRATATLTFGLGKPGLYVTPGADYAGLVEVLDIGFPARSVGRWATSARLLAPGEEMLRMPRRPFAGHKGTFGHVLVAAGGAGKAGAADLACRGALRAGAGLVTLCAPLGVRAEWPEIMHEWVPSFSAAAWSAELLARKSAAVFGPGTGTGDDVRAFLARLCGALLPLVIDADGLTLLAEEPGLLASRRAPTVLTPHPAEAGRLLGTDAAAVQTDRIGAARDIAERFRAVTVLKGARTVIAVPEGRFWINGSGSPALAAGGMGDVLAGAVGALLAAGMAAERAACLAVWAHGKAGEAPGNGAGGLRASEAADRLPGVLDTLVS